MDGILLTRISQIQQMTTAVEHFGASPEKLLRRLNMPMWHHCAPDGFVPLDHLYRFAHRAAHVLGMETYGVKVMEHLSIRSMGRISEAIFAAPTLYQALQTAARLFPVHGTTKNWWLAEEAEEAWFCRGGGRVSDVGEEQSIQYALMGIAQIVRGAAGPGWRPAKIKVRALGSLDLETTEMFGDCLILPDPSVSAVAIPRPLLSLPMRDRGRTPGAVDAYPPPAEDFPGSLRQIIATLLSEGSPSIECAAEIAGLHVRTLQRLLQAEGVSYKQMVNEERCAEATARLKEPGASVTAIAYDLGYTDAAHFTRAFRRWAGVAPSAYRRLHAVP